VRADRYVCISTDVITGRRITPPGPTVAHARQGAARGSTRSGS
jgi:hypothetical protein